MYLSEEFINRRLILTECREEFLRLGGKSPEYLFWLNSQINETFPIYEPKDVTVSMLSFRENELGDYVAKCGDWVVMVEHYVEKGIVSSRRGIKNPENIWVVISSVRNKKLDIDRSFGEVTYDRGFAHARPFDIRKRLPDVVVSDIGNILAMRSALDNTVSYDDFSGDSDYSIYEFIVANFNTREEKLYDQMLNKVF